MSIKISGVNEIIAALAKKEADIRKAGQRANTAGGKVVATELERQVPVGLRMGMNKLVNTVSVSNNRADKNSMQSYVAVGFPKGVSHRIHVTEFGSISQPATGFMTKTVAITAKDVQKAMVAEVRRVLR